MTRKEVTSLLTLIYVLSSIGAWIGGNRWGHRAADKWWEGRTLIGQIYDDTDKVVHKGQPPTLEESLNSLERQVETLATAAAKENATCSLSLRGMSADEYASRLMKELDRHGLQIVPKPQPH